ncbi:fatty acyl-AMP ligase [Pseudomonas chlororaphis subsp. aurantiaca]|uniref:fatty acyl-AMP ligase n=1 Tax=Pseudomonas chlororaphis TaxID=587753 RepID=UPI000F6C5C0A|nr:Polyketide synthase [Pseudomonas chlororaphis subsp. aurantiaca]
MTTNDHDSDVPYANFSECLQLHAHMIPDRLAYRFLHNGRDEETLITFSELDRAARAAAARLQGHCRAGDRVLILLKPGLDYVIAFMGCLYAGLVAVPAYPPGATKTLDRLDGIIDDCQPTAALASGEDVPTILARLGQAESPRVLDMATLDLALASEWRPVPVTRDDIAFLQYTSGSTGIPKGVAVTHGNLIHNSRSISRGFLTHKDSHLVSWLPPYHDMGLIGGILQSLFVGFGSTLLAPIHFLQRPLRWLQAISTYRGTVSGGPNFAYELCLRKIKDEELAGLDLSSWEVAFNGAEHVRAQTIAAFHERFARAGFASTSAFPCYGLAEGTLMVSAGGSKREPVIRQFHAGLLEDNVARLHDGQGSDAELRLRTLVSSGRGIPGQGPFICDPHTEQPLEDGRVGEICILGDSVASGYWQRPESTAAAFRPAPPGLGWSRYFRTGDLGFLLDGELFVTGRLKDLIIVNGVNHHPGDIENTVLRTHDSFRPDGTAAFSIETGDSEQVVIAQEIERRALRSLDLPQLFSDLKARLWQQHQLARPVLLLVFGGSLPRTSSGKIKRQECRKQFAPWLAALEGTAPIEAHPLDKSVVAVESNGRVLRDITVDSQVVEA